MNDRHAAPSAYQNNSGPIGHTAGEAKLLRSVNYFVDPASLFLATRNPTASSNLSAGATFPGMPVYRQPPWAVATFQVFLTINYPSTRGPVTRHCSMSRDNIPSHAHGNRIRRQDSARTRRCRAAVTAHEMLWLNQRLRSASAGRQRQGALVRTFSPLRPANGGPMRKARRPTRYRIRQELAVSRIRKSTTACRASRSLAPAERASS
jgi:hypothetical protein